VPTASPARHRAGRDDTPPGPPARWRPGHSRRRLLWGLLAVPVLVAGGLYLSGGAQPAPRAPVADAASPSQSAMACGSAEAGPCAVSSPIHIAVAQVPPSDARTPGRSGRPSHRPTPTASPPAGASANSTPSPSATATASAPASQPAPLSGTAAAQVLALINQARAGQGLPALTFSSGLNASAAAHNATMEAGCGLSHQCPGEPALGDRETAAGVHWTAAGENIGDGGPVAGTSSAIAQMAVGLTQDMLNEKPPDDGHRLNILSTSFAHIGIAVSIDHNDTVWMTQDFSS